MPQVRAIADHEVPSRPPLRVEPGDVVRVGERSSEWPAFVFVESDSGRGWVPSRHLDTTKDLTVVEVAYHTKELAVRSGEILDLRERDDESGWHWCRNGAGDEGWVPVAVLEELPETLLD
ncbi:MAG TPA: SH3 domain-containing protein [Acidimicrobiia bacterium]|jgi:hypothetical protein|nr:SH3 domain-containing protein [Acidimicrobiia bacterium]